MTARLRLLLWPAAAALGLAAEARYYGLRDVRQWVPDLAAGWSLIACGLLAWDRMPGNVSGPLMAAAGTAWFGANFSDALVYLHRGPLVQLLLCYPRGRPGSWYERTAVVVGYAAAVLTPVWDNDVLTIVLAGAIVAVAIARQRRATPLERTVRAPGSVGAIVFALVLAGGAVGRLAGSAPEPTLLIYELTLCALAVGLLLGLDRTERARAAVVDLAVELGDQSGTLRDALAHALGDPTLELGYWIPRAGEFVDATGKPLRLPAADSGQRVTQIERGGAPVAALVHQPAALDDLELAEALASAVRLAAANAELQADVRAQLTEVGASRRRLVRAADEERRHLDKRLNAGALSRLQALAQSLRQARDDAAASDAAAAVARAQQQAELTVSELRELAAGLHPATLAQLGLRDALTELAQHFPLSVEVTAPAERLPPEAEATVWFVCSEAVANAAKHAHATRVQIVVDRGPATILARVSDDGAGGADPEGGSGLRGLIDRVEALGGRLDLTSAIGAGTTLVATIPVSGAASGQR